MIEAYEDLVREIGEVTAAQNARRLFRSWSTNLALAIVLIDGELTAVHLQDIGTPMASAYRNIAELERMGIIESGERFQASRGGGPRTKVWRLRKSR